MNHKITVVCENCKHRFRGWSERDTITCIKCRHKTKFDRSKVEVGVSESVATSNREAEISTKFSICAECDFELEAHMNFCPVCGTERVDIHGEG